MTLKKRMAIMMLTTVMMVMMMMMLIRLVTGTVLYELQVTKRVFAILML